MRYELRSEILGSAPVDSTAGILDDSSPLVPLAEAAIRFGDFPLTPTGPFLPVSWADPAALAAQISRLWPDYPVEAVDESGAVLALPEAPLGDVEGIAF